MEHVHEFAAQMKQAARNVTDPEARFGNKVFLRAVYEARTDRMPLTYQKWAAGMVACHNAGALELTRLDLTEIMDSRQRRWDQEGEIRYHGATFHMMRVD